MRLMGQLFNRFSCTVRGRRDTLVVEPMAGRGVTLRGESSSGSYTGKVSRRGDTPSTSGGRCRDVGLDDDSARREVESRRQEYLNQFDKDPMEQRAMKAHVQARGYGGPPVLVAVPVEDDTEEDPEEDSLGTNNYAPRSYTPELVDPEDFDP
ncbi:hypothetical protein FNV43_RR17035 [Rhamnella rubrinervis]|uniref:Uncharacterized protein n=1 Tax=Rhamnella rubrinervis TaxID=2594499 RepID=A0A8K0GZV6_9ROSA|nr:hypothetical protein FNV43_RR17035 [Rhamnella rubrinervis]